MVMLAKKTPYLMDFYAEYDAGKGAVKMEFRCIALV
jgi:hypothetical protein